MAPGAWPIAVGGPRKLVNISTPITKRLYIVSYIYIHIYNTFVKEKINSDAYQARKG